MPNLADKNQCTGCTACANICPKSCIEMKEDDEGFAQPVIDNSKCISCLACERVCPILNNHTHKDEETKAYAALSKNDETRLESSSGGIFSELAELILQANGIVYGAKYDNDFKVIHTGIEDIESLKELRGAKYSQSDLSTIFQTVKKQLNNGRQVLFSGTPCQIGGLKAFLKKDYDNLYCIDFVCHGVPSPLVWKKYIEYRSQVDADNQVPEYINLRNKESGWSHYSYQVEFAYSKSNHYLCQNDKDLYMSLFVNNYILRRSCSNCYYKGYSRESDITLGDFWGIWDILPSMDDNKGTSVVFTHSNKGEKLLNSAAIHLQSNPVTLDQATMMNPSLLKSSLPKENRERVLQEIGQNGFHTKEKIIEIINQDKLKASLENKTHTSKLALIRRIIRKICA
ncbi:Coenzyme F420 hydrogenase/dehydrogenase, beta subunit C-terminal domain [Sharpea azabuensis]|uniref:Coenzyme F420 hydrogenase/dehydrogenase, beta subunit C-terminal domain n=1 Tax=Sharpea azabuensis TaxID=322505 RepID=UPI00156BE541|nr:Coenzyme F420 hydrogenase/dehydrogenase, beta subunit C-terminal domain [Sharpea azabuensis]